MIIRIRYVISSWSLLKPPIQFRFPQKASILPVCSEKVCNAFVYWNVSHTHVTTACVHLSTHFFWKKIDFSMFFTWITYIYNFHHSNTITGLPYCIITLLLLGNKLERASKHKKWENKSEVNVINNHCSLSLFSDHRLNSFLSILLCGPSVYWRFSRCVFLCTHALQWNAMNAPIQWTFLLYFLLPMFSPVSTQLVSFYRNTKKMPTYIDFF